jgi:hypothetical protein
LLNGVDPEHKGWEAALQQVKRDLRAGRQALESALVMPWALWNGGAVPDEWWGSDSFAEAIGWWREHAIRRPTRPEPANILERVRELHVDAMREPRDNVLLKIIAMPTLADRVLAAEHVQRSVHAIRGDPWIFGDAGG